MEVALDQPAGRRRSPGEAVYVSETALAADGLIVCNRVKPHHFRGELESGLAKITAIGLGKHQGPRRSTPSGRERMALGTANARA